MSIRKEGREYPFFGYCPGDYVIFCEDCKKKYVGDKRSWRCEPCAERMAQARSEPHVVSEPEGNGAREALIKIVRETTGLLVTFQVEMLTDQILARLWMARFVIKPFE